MSKRYLLVVLLAIMVWAGSFCGLLVQEAKAGETTPIAAEEEEHREVKIRVRISWDPKILPFDREGIVGLLANRPSHVLGLSEDIEKVLKNDDTYSSFEHLPVYSTDVSNRGLILGTYGMEYLPSVADEEQARKAMEAVVKQLRELLEQEYKAYVGIKGRELMSMDRSRDDAERKLDRTQVELEQFIRLEKLHPGAKSDLLWKMEKSRGLILDFERQDLRLDMELKAKAVRLEAVQEEIAKVSVQVVEAEQNNKETKSQLIERGGQLASRLRIVQRDIEQKNIEIQKATSEVYKAKSLEILKSLKMYAANLESEMSRLQASPEALYRRRRADFPLQGASALLAKLKVEQSSLVIDRLEMEARYHETENKLAQARHEMPELLNELQLWEVKQLRAERMRAELSLARKRYERAVMLMDQPRREYEAVQRMGPRIEIIKAKKENKN